MADRIWHMVSEPSAAMGHWPYAVLEATRARIPRRIPLTILFVLAACAQPAHPHPERWARAWIASVNSHRLGEIHAVLAADATYADPLSKGLLRGDGIFYYFSWFWSANPDAVFTVVAVSGDARAVT